jgi:hypothetical protein
MSEQDTNSTPGGDEVEGHSFRGGLIPDTDDVEGHGAFTKHVDTDEGDDVEAHKFKGI